MPFPRNVNAPAGFRNLMPLKVVPPGKSLFGLVRTLPPKNSESPGDTASPRQFAGVLQKSFPPPPFQVRSAATAAVSAARKAGMESVHTRGINVFIGMNHQHALRETDVPRRTCPPSPRHVGHLEDRYSAVTATFRSRIISL